MRIFGLGTDIVDLGVVHLASELNTTVRKQFTKAEQEYCDSKHYPQQHYAARWAAKEATLKALGRGLSSGMSNIEVGKMENGAPTIILHGKLAEEFDYLRFMVSISHARDAYATATVIAFFNE